MALIDLLKCGCGNFVAVYVPKEKTWSELHLGGPTAGVDCENVDAQKEARMDIIGAKAFARQMRMKLVDGGKTRVVICPNCGAAIDIAQWLQGALDAPYASN